MISSRKEMPDVETKVSTVVVLRQVMDGHVRGRIEDLVRTKGFNGFQLLPDGTKTEVQNKKTVKVRSKDTPIWSR